MFMRIRYALRVQGRIQAFNELRLQDAPKLLTQEVASDKFKTANIYGYQIQELPPEGKPFLKMYLKVRLDLLITLTIDD